MMENYLYIMYNQINKAMQKIMRSLFIATLLLVSMGMGAYAQETKKTFTPKHHLMVVVPRPLPSAQPHTTSIS